MHTISILPTRHRLLTVPKDNLPLFMHAILLNLFTVPRDAILNITENELEVSIIASEQVISEYFPANGTHGLFICEDPYIPLQLDGDIAIENAGQRINDVSAPLAAAGISILYLSTYQTDFVLVKERKIPMVLDIHASLIDVESMQYWREKFPAQQTSSEQLVSPIKSPPLELDSSNAKTLLGRSLSLVGLNREYQGEWTMPLIKAIFYQDAESRRDRFFSLAITEDGISMVVETDVLSLFRSHWLNMSVTPEPLRCLQVDLSQFGLDRYGIVVSLSEPLTNAGVHLLYLSTFKTANLLVYETEVEIAVKVFGDSFKKRVT